MRLWRSLLRVIAPRSECVYRQHNPSMLRVCQGLVRNRATAEEIVQDTWVAVLKGIGGFEGRSSLADGSSPFWSTRHGRGLNGTVAPFHSMARVKTTVSPRLRWRGRWKDMPDLWETVTPDRILEGRDIMAHVTAAIDTASPGAAVGSDPACPAGDWSQKRFVPRCPSPKATCAFCCTGRGLRSANRWMHCWQKSA